MNIHIIRTNRSEEHRTSTPARAIEDVEKLIGADLLDTVNLRDGRVMFVDDLGHQKGSEVNHRATELYHSVCKPGTTHQIVGDVAIVVDEDFA